MKKAQEGLKVRSLGFIEMAEAGEGQSGSTFSVSCLLSSDAWEISQRRRHVGGGSAELDHRWEAGRPVRSHQQGEELMVGRYAQRGAKPGEKGRL